MLRCLIGFATMFGLTASISAQDVAQAPIAEKAGAEMPWWISVFTLMLCGFIPLGVLLIAVVSGFLLTRKSGASSREIAELREENARLREEVERLKKAQSPASSTDIKEG